MRLAIGNLKGGAGKTTTSVRLALGLSRTGSTLLVDCDPEQSQSFDWSARSEDWPHERLTVLPVSSRDMYNRVKPMLSNYAHVVFDTGAKNPELLRQAMSLADDLIIPSQATDGDLLEIPKVYAMAAEVDMTHPLRAVVLLTKVRSGTNEEAEAREYLAEVGIPVMKSIVAIRRELGRMRDAPADLLDYENVLVELLTEE